MLYIAIVEDEPVIGNYLKKLLEGRGAGVTLYASGEEVLEKMQPPLPDAVLMDINLSGISGIETTLLLKQRYPELEIVVQTILEDTATILEAIKAGASGYLLKASPAEEIISALEEVKRGGSFLTGKVARKMLGEFQKEETRQLQKKEPMPVFSLTTREEEILQELIQGASYKEISVKLSISHHTVNNHIRKIYEKLRVNSKAEAVAKAISEMKYTK